MVDRQTDLWSVEVAEYHLWIAKPEAPDDLFAHGWRGCCSQRHPHVGPKRVGLSPEPKVVGTEVLAPLADQMCLVDHEQTRLGTEEHRPRLTVRELLGRDEHERVGAARCSERLCWRPLRLLGVHDAGR